DRSKDADLRVARDQPNEHRRAAHQDESPDQHRLAADLVSEVATNDSAKRTHDGAGAEGAKREQSADQRIKAREEDAVEDQRRRGSVNTEIVPLDAASK